MIEKSTQNARFLEYLNFFEGINTTSLISGITQENLNKHKITILDQNGQFIKSQKNPRLQIKQIYRQAVIVQYEVFISKFKFQITMINNDRTAPKFNKNEKAFDTFTINKVELQPGKQILIKKQHFKQASQFTKKQQQWRMSANKQQIDCVIIELCFYKICSLYKIGPAVDTEIGFDLLCYRDYIEFYLQFCDQLYQEKILNQNFDYQLFELQMKQNLKLMHELNLIHKDVNLNNMVYSKIQQRYVLTNFGLVYISQQIQKVYGSGKKSQIDLYQNDFYTMRSSFKQILFYKKKYYQKKNKQVNKEQQIQKKQIGQQQALYNYYSNQCRQSLELSILIHQKITGLNQEYQLDSNEFNQISNSKLKNEIEKNKMVLQAEKERQINLRGEQKKAFQLFQNQLFQRKLPEIISVSPLYYQYISRNFIHTKKKSLIQSEIRNKPQLQKISQYYNNNQWISEIQKIPDQSEIEKETSFQQQQQLILSKIQQMIDQNKIKIPSITYTVPDLEQVTELKLRNYIRIYGYDIETINLCQSLQIHTFYNKYLKLLQKIIERYCYKLKKLKHINCTYYQGMVLKHLRNKLTKLKIEQNKDQRQILKLCIQIMKHDIEQYEKQEYIKIIQMLSIKMNEEQDLIYKIETLFKKQEEKIIFHEQKYSQIIQIISRIQDEERKSHYISLLFNKLYNYSQYQKSIQIGLQLLKLNSNKDQIDQQNKQKKRTKKILLYHQLIFLYNKIENYQESLYYSSSWICQQPMYIASIYYQVSQEYIKSENHQQAQKYSKKSLLIKQSFYGPSHPYMIKSYYQLSSIYRLKGQYNNTLKQYTKYIKINMKQYGQQHPKVATCYHELSLIYLDMKKYQQALNQSDKSIQIYKKIYGQKHLDVATCYYQLSQICLKMSNYQKAITYSQKCKEIRVDNYKCQQHPDVANCYHQLSKIYLSMQNYETALKYSKQSLQLTKRYYNDENHPNIAQYQYQIYLIYDKMQNSEEAMKYKILSKMHSNQKRVNKKEK